MKKLVLLLITLVSFVSIDARQVNEQEAKMKAQQFFGKANHSYTGRKKIPRKTPNLVLANNRDELYVFNDKANGGYVVISGDDRMPDVLAYSYDGLYDENNIPCNMKSWMDDYAGQIVFLRANSNVKTTRQNVVERENINPLLTCWFGQGTPYNDKCPEVNGKRCPSGCVATAMAQIMYYHQWPMQTTREIPGYTTSTHGIVRPQLPITTIDWDNINNKYRSGIYNDEQADAVSTLMLLCGSSVSMDYTPEASGSYSDQAANALMEYFDYDESLDIFYRGSDPDGWEEMIYEELKDNRPVYYSGAQDMISGHAFVMDGYEDGYFHVNWGWGSSFYDSYVLMTDVGGYKYSQAAIVGIKPAIHEYAVLDNGKMILYYDKEMYHRSGTIIPYKDNWGNYANEITECVIDSSFANLRKTSLSRFFAGWNQLNSIENIGNLNMDKVTDMSHMFSGCANLTNLDLSSLNMDNVTNMGGMFYGCSSLTSLDLSGLNTENVTYMAYMFSGCSCLTSLSLNNFNTDKVTNMSGMFYGCSSLTSLDLSSLNTENVAYMEYMFFGCSSLASLSLNNFNTDNVTNMSAMFRDCSKLTNLDLSGFNTDNVTNMSTMFRDCSKLTNLDLSGFNTDNVTNMGGMFSSCFNLTSLDLSGFNTNNVTDVGDMFYGCSNLTSLDLSGFNTEHVTRMGSMFSNCCGLTILDLSCFNTEHVTVMSGMFSGCSNLKSIFVGNDWTTGAVQRSVGGWRNGTGMFSGCSMLVGGSGTKYDSNHTDYTYAHIDGGTSNPGYFSDKVSPFLCTLTYMVDGEVYKTFSVVYGTTIILEDEPMKEGYTFSGWSELPETMPANDVTVTGTFTINSYTLTYILDGEVYKTESVVFGTPLEKESALTKEGYIFSGWRELPETMPAHDVDVTSYFIPNNYTLIYILDGEIYKSYEVEFGSTITPEPVPTKAGHTFCGWSELPETMPANDVVVTGTFYIYGDVNTDEEVDVVDVIDIARYVVATPTAKFREKLADLNFDNAVNIADAVTLVNHIAGNQNFVKALASSGLSYDYDWCQLQLQSAGQDALSLCLDGEADFTAFQFDVDVPEGTDISAISINGIRKDGHKLLYNKLAEGRYRVTAFSFSNAVFKDSKGELLQFCINGQATDDICVHDIHFITTNGKDITFDALYVSGTETGVNSLQESETSGAIYDLQGRKLSKMQRGVNIVNGKKYIIK